MANLSLQDLRQRLGRIEIFVGKLMSGDPFTTKSDRQYYANSLVIKDGSGKVTSRYEVNSEKDVQELIKALRFAPLMSNNVYVSNGNDSSALRLGDLKVTGEFGFRGNNYSGNEPLEIREIRQSLTKAIVQSRGPITLVVNNKKFYDICDVISPQISGSLQKSNIEFINRWGESQVFISAKNLGNTDGYEQTAQLYQGSYDIQNFVKDLQAKYKDGFVGQSVFRRFSENTDSRITEMRAVYGLDYRPGNKFSPYNVNAVCSGNITLSRTGDRIYRITSSGIVYNGETPHGQNEVVMIAEYASNSNDFGLNNAKVRVEARNGKGTKEI